MLIIKDLSLLPSFISKDNTTIIELLHPKNDLIELPYSIAFGKLEPGASSLPHRLKGHIEVYYFLGGLGELVVGKEKVTIGQGSIALVPHSEFQYLINTGPSDLKFLCLVSPPWTEETDNPTEEF
jgi:mannose-6-phosphate isomerase-like protein (cupin superfamily)